MILPKVDLVSLGIIERCERPAGHLSNLTRVNSIASEFFDGLPDVINSQAETSVALSLNLRMVRSWSKLERDTIDVEAGLRLGEIVG